MTPKAVLSPSHPTYTRTHVHAQPHTGFQKSLSVKYSLNKECRTDACT